MENVLEIISFLDDDDKKSLLDFAGILLKKNKYSRLRKEIEFRRSEVVKGEVLSHEEIWQD
ncbi:MAG: hypothetical protein HQK72_12965 [Desulfamplus sp.]|nr:hypothetical protein [Desulfamplus sp.]